VVADVDLVGAADAAEPAGAVARGVDERDGAALPLAAAEPAAPSLGDQVGEARRGERLDPGRQVAGQRLVVQVVRQAIVRDQPGPAVRLDEWLPASSAGLLLATEPVWVLVISYVFLGERAGPRVLLGSGVALAGVAVIAGPSALSSGYGMRAVAGAALVLLATMAFGGYTIVLRPLSEKYGPVSATAVSTVLGAVPYLAFVRPLWPSRLSQPAWAELLFLALGSTVAGMLLWNQAIVRGGSARISRLLYLEPVVSVLGAMVFLGERATAAVLVGGVLLIAGVLMTVGSGHSGRRPAPVST
jgi:uncharacterized membrane protein